METVIDSVTVEVGEFLPESMIRECIRMAEKDANAPIDSIYLARDRAGDIRVDYVTARRKFERIRRITGYLVGTIDRWNNAKKAEERERVKHA